MGHNGEAAPRVCVPANEVSVLIGLLYFNVEKTLVIVRKNYCRCSVKREVFPLESAFALVTLK